MSLDVWTVGICRVDWRSLGVHCEYLWVSLRGGRRKSVEEYVVEYPGPECIKDRFGAFKLYLLEILGS